MEKEMATHSSVLAWRIPRMGEPGGLPSMGSHRVGHDWSDLAAAAVPIKLLTKAIGWTSLVIQWLKIHLAMQDTAKPNQKTIGWLDLACGLQFCRTLDKTMYPKENLRGISLHFFIFGMRKQIQGGEITFPRDISTDHLGDPGFGVE